MREKIIYIGFYSDQLGKDEGRYAAPAATDKMNYIAHSIVNAGFDVEVISPAWSIKKQWILKNGRKSVIGDGITNVYIPIFSSPTKILNPLKRYFSIFWLFCQLLVRTNKNTNVLIYHSVLLCRCITLAKWIKKFQLILEVEEIYGNVFKMSDRSKKRELRMIETADSYLFANDMMPTLLGIKAKKFVVVYGVYRSEKVKIRSSLNDKINIVYAGIIDKLKAGAFNAIRSAKYLNENFTMKVIGFGADHDIQQLKEEILEIKKETTCEIRFDGTITGTEYIDYMQNCEIGLSSQKVEGEYLLYTFPSKVLSYLTLGLRVVSGKIEAVQKSKIGGLLYYYNDDNPEEIAEAIKKVNIHDDYDGQNIIKELNWTFVNELSILFHDNVESE